MTRLEFIFRARITAVAALRDSNRAIFSLARAGANMPVVLAAFLWFVPCIVGLIVLPDLVVDSE